MKNFTFLLAFLVVSLGYAQELVTNGDFESGDAGWSGNAVNVVTENGNSYNAANVETVGNPWDVNLSYVLSLEAGVSYVLSFDAWSDQDRVMTAGIGLNEAPWDNANTEVNLTSGAQSYSFTFVNPVTSDNNRIIFDMGHDTGFVGIDNVSLMVEDVTPTDGPTVAAPMPPGRPVADVVSVFSDAYASIEVNEWGPNWGDSSCRFVDVMVEENPTKVMDVNAGQVFGGIDFAPSAFDATDFTHFHMDYWIADPLPAGQILNIKLSNHDGGAGETSAIQFTATPQSNQWVQLDIPLDDFVAASGNGLLDRNAIAQIIITAARADANETVDVYLDNIYFHKGTMGVNDVISAEKVAVYPNPVKAGQQVMFTGDVEMVEVYGATGQRVKAAKSNALNTSGLAQGVYFLRITTQSGELQMQKLIVK